MGLKSVEPEEQARFKELNRLRMKLYRDRKRVRKYSPRLKKDQTVTPKKTGDEQ